MKRLVIPAFVIGLALASEPDPSFAQKPGCYTVWVAAESLGMGDAIEMRANPHRRRGRPFDFAASELLDIHFYVLMPGEAERNVDLEIYTPQGHLYQTLTVEPQRVSGRHASKGRGRQPPRFAWGTEKLPVAGTTIVNSSLYGQWTVVPLLDGDSAPCARPRAFELSP